MKGILQIALIVACLVPLSGLAKEETMAERRQRIMRKYLRGHANVAQSELEVDVARPEDEVLANSEQFKEAQVGLQRHEAATPMPPPPPPRRRRPTAQERNWLLAADPTLGDPLASADDEESPKKPADWTLWGGQDREESLYGETPYNKSWYGRKEDPSVGTSGYGPRRQKSFSSSTEIKPFSFGRDPSVLQQKEAIPSEGYSGIFGRKQEQPSGSGLGTLDLTRDPIHDPNLNQSRLKSPFLRESTPPAERPIGFGSRTKSYTPYKSPYETQRQQQQQQQQWGGQGQQQQEYKRVDPYQKWKKRKPSYDPTAGDAYVNELMPKKR